MQKLLRLFLICGGCYFIFDGILHFSNIKLSSVISSGNWPIPAVLYAHLLSYIYGSFIILASIIAFVIQRDLKKYKTLILVTGVWAIFHGAVLLFLVTNQNYQEIFKSLPSLLVWLPFYREYLTINALLLFFYGGIVYFWYRKSS